MTRLAADPHAFVRPSPTAGLAEVWDLVDKHERMLHDSGELAHRRSDQRVTWMAAGP